MKYQIDIQGIHCMGCVNLIKMSLEDEGFSNVEVDLDRGNSVFETEETISNVSTKLEQIFSDLSDYSFTNLQTIN